MLFRSIVENMAGYVVAGTVAGAKAGTEVALETGAGLERVKTDASGRFEVVVPVFGSGGAERLARKHGFPVLGRVPLNPVVRVGGDAGDPVTIVAPDSPIAKEFGAIAGRLAQKLAIAEHRALPVLQ